MTQKESLASIELRVQQAPFGKNKGCLRANMHPSDRMRLQLNDGAFLLLTGTGRTSVQLADAGAEVAEGVLLLPAQACVNAGVGPGDNVRIAAAAVSPAISVTLARIEDSATDRGRQQGWLARIFRRAASAPEQMAKESLAGMVVMQGDEIHAEQAGINLRYRVVQTVPEAPVLINSATQIQQTPSRPAEGVAASYDEVGGLGHEVARVREMVELPMRHPEIFAHLGITPPRGLLLYGPPGCGKTLIARAVARDSGAHFIHVNGPEIIQKHYGESEELLRNLFAEAQRHESSILFFDEIDAIAPNRETVLGDVEKRVVAQLLALMDGLENRGQIIVLAATNLPNNVDPALRRPGRFDREIAINAPNKNGRLEILRIHSRIMPLAHDVDLGEIAAKTHGFLGADLAALCREAAMQCARDLKRNTELDAHTIEALKVSRRHFEQALAEFDLSTTRQVNTEIAEARWQHVGGHSRAKQMLRESVEWPLQYPERFAAAGAVPARGILLTGAPGTGKTLLARAIATESGVNFISVKGPELLSKWVGDSERSIREVFRKARQSAPAILFFDEIDAIAPKRGSEAGASNISDRMVGQLLLELDGLENAPGVVVLAATNRPELLDAALLRPGRFDLSIPLESPEEQDRLEILQIHTALMPLSDAVSLADLAKATVGMSGAELQALCRRAVMAAIAESIAQEPTRNFAPIQVLPKHFAQACSEVTDGQKKPALLVE